MRIALSVTVTSEFCCQLLSLSDLDTLFPWLALTLITQITILLFHTFNIALDPNLRLELINR